MRRIVLIVAVLCWVWRTGLPAFAQSSAAPEASYLALLPLSGSPAEQGGWCQRGFELAVAELRAQGVIVQMRYQDTRGEAREAVTAYRKGIRETGSPVVFTWGSSVAMSLAPITNSDGVLQMGVATATPEYRTRGDYTFRLFPSAESEAQFLSKVLERRFKGQRLGALYIENDYGIGSFEALRALLESRNIYFVAAEVHTPNITDFRSQLLRIRSLKPEVLYLASYPNDAALLIRQAREVGISAQFLGSVAVASVENLSDLAGGAAEGMLLSSTAVDPASSFARTYAATFGAGGTAMSYAARSFDALMVVEQARKSCGSDFSAACLAKALLALEYKGASGAVRFDDAGDAEIQYVLNRIEGRNALPDINGNF